MVTGTSIQKTIPLPCIIYEKPLVIEYNMIQRIYLSESMFWTTYYTITGLEETALYYGMSSLKTAIAIGLGIGVAYSLPPELFGWKRRS